MMMLYYNLPINISIELWREILTDQDLIDDKIISILQVLYNSKKHEASGGEIAKALNYAHHALLNRIVPDFAKRILKKYPHVIPPQRADGTIRYWHIPFLGTEGNDKFTWILREELAIAISEIYDLNVEEFYYPEEVEEQDVQYIEGGCKHVYVNKYERDPQARKKCLQHHGYQCKVCAFDFESMYGAIGKGIIHVHHITSISSRKAQYELNPITDLVPVCPNCHTMLHSRKDILTIEDLQDIVKQKKQEMMQ